MTVQRGENGAAEGAGASEDDLLRALEAAGDDQPLDENAVKKLVINLEKKALKNQVCVNIIKMHFSELGSESYMFYGQNTIYIFTFDNIFIRVPGAFLLVKRYRRVSMLSKTVNGAFIHYSISKIFRKCASSSRTIRLSLWTAKSS